MLRFQRETHHHLERCSMLEADAGGKTSETRLARPGCFCYELLPQNFGWQGLDALDFLRAVSPWLVQCSSALFS